MSLRQYSTRATHDTGAKRNASTHHPEPERGTALVSLKQAQTQLPLLLWAINYNHTALQKEKMQIFEQGWSEVYKPSLLQSSHSVPASWLVLRPRSFKSLPSSQQVLPSPHRIPGKSLLHAIDQDLKWSPGLSLGLPLLPSCPTLVPIPPHHPRSYFQPTPLAGLRKGHLLQQY